ncbi:hypothetical protein O0L34_g10208 [Tuta absoluta]|nr:hypothetical protein O0L34_g10208 [Tuta absoluta]
MFSVFPASGASKLSGTKRELTPNKGGPFAAALRSLAKNAGPDGKEGPAPDREKEKPPAPAHAPPPAKRASPAHHLPSSGFQPYRPDDRLTHPAAAAASFPLLEPTAYSPYAHPGLYSSAALQYRLAAEEQLYLERVFRSGVAGVGWLPPYALYPPLAPPLPLVHHAHPAHAHQMHEDREKEIAAQRERDRERERERERERDREREREQREKEQRERDRLAREKETRAREALRDEQNRLAAAAMQGLPPHLLPPVYGLPRPLLPPPLLYRPYRPYPSPYEQLPPRAPHPTPPAGRTTDTPTRAQRGHAHPARGSETGDGRYRGERER